MFVVFFQLAYIVTQVKRTTQPRRQRFFPPVGFTVTAMERACATGGTEGTKHELQRKVRNNDVSVTLTPLEGKSKSIPNFMRVECDGTCTPYAACKSCSVIIKYTPESGTSGLQRHKCKTNSRKRQKPISAFVKRKLPLSVKSSLTDKIARMCSQDGRPFAMVEGGGFVSVAQELLNIGAKYGRHVKVGDVLPRARSVSRHCDGVDCAKEEQVVSGEQVDETDDTQDPSFPSSPDPSSDFAPLPIDEASPVQSTPLPVISSFFDELGKKRAAAALTPHQERLLQDTGTERDEHEQFLLSLAPALRRLEPRQQSLVRLRFQQTLFDIEFGE